MGGATPGTSDDNTVSFAHKLAEPPRFKALFRDGMSLVEEVAAYLDGPGRDDAKSLDRPLALAYAAESMRLTTRLMQLASWLLVQRAVNEGEMTLSQATVEKNKVRLSAQQIASGPEVFARLPETLRRLTERSIRLQTRLVYLDRCMSGLEDPTVLGSDGDDAEENILATGPAALGRQWDMIRSAFNGR